MAFSDDICSWPISLSGYFLPSIHEMSCQHCKRNGVRANVISGVDFFFFLFKSWHMHYRDRQCRRETRERVEIVLIHFLKPLPRLSFTVSIFIQCASILQCPRLQGNTMYYLFYKAHHAWSVSRPDRLPETFWSIEPPTNDIICSVQ